jgi:hypothetical protein
MARYTKTGTPNTIGQINAELDLIALAINDTLSRVGDFPNQLETSLDINSNRILNPLAQPLSNNTITFVTSLVSLAAIAIGQISVYLDLGGRSGVFNYDSTVSAATIAADPEQGVYVASNYGGAWVRQDSGYVTPEMYGGNLVAAINSGRKVVGSETTYTMATVANVTTDRQVLNLIASSVKSLLTSGSAIVISADGVQLDIDYDGDNKQVTPIQITNAADRTKVKGTIRDVQAKLGMVNTYIGGVDNRGSNSDIDVTTIGFTNDGYATNGAMPHGVTFQGGAISGEVSLAAEGGTCGIVFGVCTDPHIKNADLQGLTDNGLYFLDNCVNPTFDFVKYDGLEEPVVSKATNAYGSTLVIVNQLAAMGVDESNGLTIDHIILQTTAAGLAAVKAARVPLIQTRSGNTTSINLNIGKVTGDSYGNNIFQFSNGALNGVKIHNVELTHHYHNASQSTNLYTHAGAGDEVGFRGWRLKVIDELALILVGVTGGISSGSADLTVNDASNLVVGMDIEIAGVTGAKQILSIAGLVATLDSNADATVSGAAVVVSGTLTGSDTMSFNLPTTLSKPSYYDDMRLVKEGAFRIRVNNINQDSLSIGGSPDAEVSFGPYLREEEYLTPRKEVTSTAIPTVGKWRRGDVVNDSAPTAGGYRGWIATADVADASVDNTAFKTFGAISS